MVETMSIVIGVGLSIAILFYLSQTFKKENDEMLQILGLVSLISGLLLLLVIPMVLFDSQQQCEVVVANSTDESNVTTAYAYTAFCYSDARGTLTGYYKVVLWFFRVFVIIMMLRLCWIILQLFMQMGGKRSR